MAVTQTDLLPLLFETGPAYIFSFLDPHGPVAAAQKYHLIWVVAITMIAILPVFILIPGILWRYRYKNKKACYTPHWDFSHRLEWIMWGVPFAIIGVLSVLLWGYTKSLDPYKPIDPHISPLNLQVVALNWKWLFIYPEQGIASIGEMAFPVHRPVSLSLTSDTVMQSFMISALVGQIYVMPGMKTRLFLKAEKPGIFEGENTQFNGVGFPQQKFKALALSEETFKTWVQKVKVGGIPLDSRNYSILANRSVASEVHEIFKTQGMPSGVTYFKRVSPNLFANIINKYHSGKPVEAAQQPGGAKYNSPHMYESEK